VVFNEMKGAFSDNQSILGEALLNQLLPSNTYGVVSGGDPLLIPSLTYQQLKDFHLKFYNPSNARFFSYGDMPLHTHLEFIHSEYLSK
jgi:Zn-dependent M16 (insulinase) family peptidase